MTWWIWEVLGIILLTAELLTPGGFFIFFFGVGAMIIGLIAAIFPKISPEAQLSLFPVVSVALLLIFRSQMQALFAPKSAPGDVDNLQGAVCIALDDIPPNSFGKVEARGSIWSARNMGSLNVSKGERCSIQRVEGLSLQIAREE